MRPSFSRCIRTPWAYTRLVFHGRQYTHIQPIHPISLGATPFQLCTQNLTARNMSTSNQTKLPSHPKYNSFFHYTSGRWVWDEERQLRDRYKAFNVSELQKIATKAVRSNRCNSMTKLAEGGYNKVFRLHMDDGKTVLARIPNPIAGPSFYTTASEVATMELVSRPKW